MVERNQHWLLVGDGRWTPFSGAEVRCLQSRQENVGCCLGFTDPLKTSNLEKFKMFLVWKCHISTSCCHPDFRITPNFQEEISCLFFWCHLGYLVDRATDCVWDKREIDSESDTAFIIIYCNVSLLFQSRQEPHFLRWRQFRYVRKLEQSPRFP